MVATVFAFTLPEFRPAQQRPDDRERVMDSRGFPNCILCSPRGARKAVGSSRQMLTVHGHAFLSFQPILGFGRKQDVFVDIQSRSSAHSV